jgi:hypothetical protein
LTLGLNFNVKVRPLALGVHPSASHGCIRPSSPGRASASTARIWVIWRNPAAGLVVDNCATPTRSTTAGELFARGSARCPHELPSTVRAATTHANNRLRTRRNGIRYFLFIGGSSTQLPQIPVGFMLVAFFTILIFIVVSNA